MTVKAREIVSCWSVLRDVLPERREYVKAESKEFELSREFKKFPKSLSCDAVEKKGAASDWSMQNYACVSYQWISSERNHVVLLL